MLDYIENPDQDTEVKDALAKAWNPRLHTKPYDGYKEAVEYHERLEVHTDGETDSSYAVALLHTQRPNEPKAVLDYRIANLDAITTGAYGKVSNVLSAIWSPEGYNVAFPPMPASVTDTAEIYLTKRIDGGSIMDWGKSVLIHESLSDPNGYVVAIPMPARRENGWAEVRLQIFESEDVMHREGFMLLNEREGVVLYIDARSMWRVTKQADKAIWDLLHESEDDALYAHPLPHRREGDERRSFIHAAIPHWEKALKRDTDLTALEVKYSFPRHWIGTMTCSAKGCMNGKVHTPITDAFGTRTGTSEETCVVCAGTGIQRADDPYGAYQIDFSDPKLEKMPAPPLGFVTPPTETLDYMNKRVKECIDEGFSALNMDFLRREEKAGESGEAKEIARQELTNFLLDFSNAVFGIVDWACKQVVMLRYGAAYPSAWQDYAPVWTPPSYFGIISPDTAIGRIEKASTAKMDGYTLSLMGADFAELEFGADSMQAAIQRAKAELDPLVAMTSDEIMAKYADIRPEDLHINANLHRLILDALDENANWLQQPRKAKMAWLLAEAKKEMAARPKPEAEPDPNLGA